MLWVLIAPERVMDDTTNFRFSTRKGLMKTIWCSYTLEHPKYSSLSSVPGPLIKAENNKGQC